MTCKEILAKLFKNASILALNPRMVINNFRDKIDEIDRMDCRIDECTKAVDAMNKLLRLLDKADIGELEREYTRLFVSSHPQTPCPMYESVYVGGNRLLAKPSVLRDINNILLKLNMDLNRDFYTLPDSLPVELELAHTLLVLNNVDPDSLNPLTNNLLVDHLAHWLPEMSKCIEENTSHPYYKYFALLLSSLSQCIRSIY